MSCLFLASHVGCETVRYQTCEAGLPVATHAHGPQPSHVVPIPSPAPESFSTAIPVESTVVSDTPILTEPIRRPLDKLAGVIQGLKSPVMADSEPEVIEEYVVEPEPAEAALLAPFPRFHPVPTRDVFHPLSKPPHFVE